MGSLMSSVIPLSAAMSAGSVRGAVTGPDGQPMKDANGNVLMRPYTYKEYSDDLLKGNQSI